MTSPSWAISKDIIEGGHSVGVCGPSGCPLEYDAIILHPNAEKFRMYDDDDILYYQGYIVNEESGFEPLDHFGMPNAGCTRIDYWSKQEGIWEIL